MATSRLDPYSLLQQMQQQARSSAPGLPEQVQVATLWSGLGFRLADQLFVTPLDHVSEVLHYPTSTLVPTTKGWLKGIANVRGNLYTIVDLAEFFGREPIVQDEKTRLLIMNVAGLNTGVLVSEVLGLRHFDEELERQTLPDTDDPTMAHARGAFVRDGALWAVFDMSSLAQSDAFMDVAA
jgi:twitching motility protein PilI